MMRRFHNLPNVNSDFPLRSTLHLDRATCNQLHASLTKNLPKMAETTYLPGGDEDAGIENQFTKKWPSSPEKAVSVILHDMCGDLALFTKTKANSAVALFKSQGMSNGKRTILFNVLMGYSKLHDFTLKQFNKDDRLKLAAFMSQYFTAAATNAMQWKCAIFNDISWIRSYMAQCPSTTQIMAAFLHDSSATINLTDSGAVQVGSLVKFFNNLGPCEAVAPSTATQRLIEPIRGVLDTKTAFPPSTSASFATTSTSTVVKPVSKPSTSTPPSKQKVTAFKRGRPSKASLQLTELKLKQNALRKTSLAVAPTNRLGKPKMFKKQISPNRLIRLQVDDSSSLLNRRATRSGLKKRTASPVPLSLSPTIHRQTEPAQVHRSQITMKVPEKDVPPALTQFFKPGPQANIPIRSSITSEIGSTSSTTSSPSMQSQSGRYNPTVHLLRLQSSVTCSYPPSTQSPPVATRHDSEIAVEAEESLRNTVEVNDRDSSKGKLPLPSAFLPTGRVSTITVQPDSIDLTSSSDEESEEIFPSHKAIKISTSPRCSEPLKIVYSSSISETESLVSESRPLIKRKKPTCLQSSSITENPTRQHVEDMVQSSGSKYNMNVIDNKTFTVLQPPTLVPAVSHPTPNASTTPQLLFRDSTETRMELDLPITPSTTMIHPPVITPPPDTEIPDICKLDLQDDKSFLHFLGDDIPPPMVLPHGRELTIENIKRELFKSDPQDQPSCQPSTSSNENICPFHLIPAFVQNEASTSESVLQMEDPSFNMFEHIDSIPLSPLMMESAETAFEQDFDFHDWDTLLDYPGLVDN